MFSTGTGIAPFASLIRDPETYEKFDEVILTHTCREVAELKYGFDLMEEIRNNEFLSEVVGDKLKHYPTVTRAKTTPTAVASLISWKAASCLPILVFLRSTRQLTEA